MQHDAVVVGGGVAGLTCAHTLRRAGLSVLLLEARPRLGGRVASTVLETDGSSAPAGAGASDSVVVDLGASWIHKGGGDPKHVIAKLATALAIPTSPTDWDEEMAVFSASGWVDDDEVEAAADATERLVKQTRAARAALLSERGSGNARADRSLGSVLEERIAARGSPLTATERWALQSEITDDYATPLESMSVLNWDADSEYSGKIDLMVNGGYCRVFEPFTAGVDGPAQLLDASLAAAPADHARLAPPSSGETGGNLQVCLSAVVSQVAWADDGKIAITYSCPAGEEQRVATVEAAHAVISVPLGVLKQGSIEFSPPLPPAKQEAIANLGVGLLNKVFVWFEESFWDSETHAFGYVPPLEACADGQFAEIVNCEPMTGQPVRFKMLFILYCWYAVLC